MTLPADTTLAAQQVGHRYVAEHIAVIEAQVRQHPGDASHRWALFQWLCIARDWERAMRQLQVFGQLDAQSLPLVQACRDLVRAERWREEVMRGRRSPGYVFDDVPPWVQQMLHALELTGRGEFDAADEARERALDAAPSTPGRAGDLSFDWIADSDTRLGPVCEIMTAGSYRWLPFEDIASWRIAAPATLIDLVWVPCTVTLRDATMLRGFMPSRYPSPALAQKGSHAGASERDALDLGRQTIWFDSGRTGVIGDGRKTWATSEGDIGLFDWLTCTFSGTQDVPDPAAGEAPGATAR